MQVIGTLLDNALTHTGEGGRISVSVDAGPVNGDVRVSVEDSGEGMTPEVLGQVFERFYRADASRARSTGGAGLGLTIARRLVEAHGGMISATSTLGVGSRFEFDLPFSPIHKRTTEGSEES
jgi:signal transduction histidine kinase